MCRVRKVTLIISGRDTNIQYTAAGMDECHPLFAADDNVGAEKLQITRTQDHLMDSDQDDEDDYGDELHDDFAPEPLAGIPPAAGNHYSRDRRTSVSAESMAPTQGNDYVKQVIPKSDSQRERIRSSVGNNFLFRNLDEEQYEDVVDAMAEKPVANGDVVIEQGAVGDYFYVVEHGTLDCLISKGGAPPAKVTSYEAGGSFGELALMYNAPRAATIIATSDAILWALDRVTFRTILMENTARKRRMYESFLEEVPLLKSLEEYERHKIADALDTVYFEPGHQVVCEGDVGDRFYIIESGDAAVYRRGSDNDQQQVNTLSRGNYFGGKYFFPKRRVTWDNVLTSL